MGGAVADAVGNMVGDAAGGEWEVQRVMQLEMR